MKHILLIRYALLIAITSLGLSSCKKSGSSLKSIYGEWHEPANPGGYSRGLSFGSDGTFIAVFTSYPRPSPTEPSILSVTEFKGTYAIKGDSLLTTVKTMTVTDDNGSPVTTPSNQKVYEYATVKVNNNTLLLNYTTYPADAPVATQATFNRFLPD